MPYLYGKNEVNPPTVDSMFGEYKIARIHLSVSEFIDLYPEVTDEQLKSLAARFDDWFDKTFSSED